MDTVNIKINNVSYTVKAGQTILEACHEVGVIIPTLCYLKEINEIGACRLCLVEVKGARGLVTSCVYPISEGMEILTNTPRIYENRRTNLELLLSTHNKNCLACVRSGSCELQELCERYGVDKSDRFAGEMPESTIDDSAPHLIRDNSKCVLCRRCVAVCRSLQHVGCISPIERGFKTHIGSPFDVSLAETSCIHCGQCIVACPTGALREKDNTAEVWAALADPDKYVVVQPAPSVRATLGECFGDPIGTNVQGKMAAALRRLGFDKVFDTDFGADLTIMEEANELVERLQNGGKLPMITSCSPGWVKFCEYYHPNFLENLSSCKSPAQMLGAIVKSYFAEKAGIDPAKIVCVSVMPCTAKKFEITRDGEAANGVPDVDISITTRELSRMIRRAGIDWASLPEEGFDSLLGESTGAATIFGATGGVMEAALRTAVETITGKPLEKVDFHEVRGTKGIKEATYNVAGKEVNVCVASGTENAHQVLQSIERGEKNYTFIEFMACPGGCVNGGGQPYQPASVRNFTDLKALRAAALYSEDRGQQYRKSHDNPEIKQLYSDYLGKPGSHRAHELLHTHYVKREINY